MLTTNIPGSATQLTVAPQPVHVVVAEDGDQPLALVLPPLDDIAEIDTLKACLISLDDVAIRMAHERKTELEKEMEVQARRLARFSTSSTLLNRLAILAAATGDRDLEGSYLEKALEHKRDTFLLHRLGDSLMAQRREEEAKRLFEGLDLAADAHANLKLAVFHVRESHLDLAWRSVRRALEIDPVDFAARLFDGGLALLAKDYDRAIHSFRIAAQERPTSSSLFANMAIAYEKLQFHEKAFTALKRSVALDPLNLNAIRLLADLSHRHSRHEEALPSLRYFVQLEQKQADVWARLARACLELGQCDEAIAALKRQASVEETSSVWNNLGVAYSRSGQSQKAMKAFKYAMTRSAEQGGRNYFLPARNFTAMLAQHSSGKELVHLTQALINEDKRQILLTDNQLCDVYAFHLNALKRAGRTAEMVKVSEELLREPNIAEPLKQWVIGNFVGYLALVEHDADAVLSFLEPRRGWLENVRPWDEFRRSVLFNNVAFAFAEFGLVSEAETFLRRIAGAIHKEPYPTATLGLVQLRKGRLDRAVELYEEAMQLSTNVSDKVRIRQKLNLELARYWATMQPAKARRLLERVVAQKGGEDGLVRQARRELLSLSEKK